MLTELYLQAQIFIVFNELHFDNRAYCCQRMTQS